MVAKIRISAWAWAQARKELPTIRDGKRAYTRGNQCERALGIEHGATPDAGRPHPDRALSAEPDVYGRHGELWEVKALQASVHAGYGIVHSVRYVMKMARYGKRFIYVVYGGDAYDMDPATFLEFLLTFRKYDRESGSKAEKTRLLVNQRMVQWLEDRLTA